MKLSVRSLTRKKRAKLVVFTSAKLSKQELDYIRRLKNKHNMEVVVIGLKPSVTEDDFHDVTGVKPVFLDNNNVRPIANEVIDRLRLG